MLYQFDDFEFDSHRLELRKNGRKVRTEALALRLLKALLERAGALVTKEELIEEVWDGRELSDNAITVAVARLRKALSVGAGKRDPVHTVYGRGYFFAGPYASRDVTDERALPTEADLDEPPLLGRERVLARLEHALKEAQKGRGRVCVLMGEAGVGKTRVVEALERMVAKAPVELEWSFCRALGEAVPFWPWLRLARAVASTNAPEQPTLLAEFAELESAVAELAERETWEPHRVFERFARLFAQAAQEVPWILVLDDVASADEASIALLAYILEEVARLQILVVATMRQAPGARAPRPETRLPYVLGHRNCERIAVSRLHECEVHEYVAALAEDADGELARAVYALSEGNPFYMTEVMRSLEREERIDPSTLRVPDAALEIIRQIVATLSHDAREVLARAAVIGRTFELTVLCAVTKREPGELMLQLDHAVAADLVVPADDDSIAFMFRHALVRKVLEERLSPAEQRQSHACIANVLEQRHMAGKAVPARELARHLHAALPESDLRKTVDACRAAAAEAALHYAHSDVVRYLQQALEALNLMEMPSLRLRIRMWYLIALHAVGGTQGARALAEVVRLAHGFGDAPMLARAAVSMNAYPGLQPMPQAHAALTRAQQALDPEESGLRAVVLGALACTAPDSYQADRCELLLGEAAELAQHARSRAVHYRLLVCRLHARGGPLHSEEADQAADELTELHGPAPSYRMAVAPLYVGLYRTVTLLTRGDLAGVRNTVDQALRHARSIRHFLAWHFRRFQALVEVNSGAVAAGSSLLEMLHRHAEQRQFLSSEPFCAFDRIVILSELTDTPHDVDDRTRTALGYDSADPPAIWAMKVRALATAGMHEQARASLRAVAARNLSRLPCDAGYLGTLGHLAHAAAALEEEDYCAAIVPLLAPFPGHFAADFTLLADSVPHLLALLKKALGEYEEVIAHAEAAVRLSERAGLVRSAAEARLQLASLLLANGKKRDHATALALAQEVLRTSAQCGMEQTARKAADLLTDTSANADRGASTAAPRNLRPMPHPGEDILNPKHR